MTNVAESLYRLLSKKWTASQATVTVFVVGKGKRAFLALVDEISECDVLLRPHPTLGGASMTVRAQAAGRWGRSALAGR